MKAVQLSVIYLSIFISVYWNYVQTTKRGSVKGTKKDQFTITGNGTTKGGKMKIFVHVQTTGKNPNKAVPGKKQGKEAPNVKLGQSGETPSPSPTTTPPMSTQVTSASPKPKKGKHFQVTPKPPISGKIQSLKPSQSKKLAPSQSMKKHSEIKSVSSSVNNAASSTVDSAKVTPTPSANLKSSLTTSTGVLPSPNSAMSTPSPQSSGAVPVQSKQAATSGSPGSSSQPTNKQTKTSRSSASSPLPDKSSSQVSVQPSATKSVAIQSSSMSTLAPSLSVPSAVISSTPLSITPSASKTVVNPASSPASLGPSSTLPPPVKSPGAGTSSAAVTQTSSLLESSPFSSPGSTISPSKSSLTNTVATKNPTTSPDFTFSRDEHIALDEHNFFRNLHKSVPLSLNKDMVLEARKFAKKISVTGNLTHESPDKLKQIGQGENLGLVCSKVELSAARVVRKVIDTWHREACKYNFQDPDPMSKKAAHFTQLVWGASKQLGVGVAAAKNAEKNCIYVVARYKPMEALKTKEQLKTNVKKGLFDASIDCAATSKKKFFIAV